MKHQILAVEKSADLFHMSRHDTVPIGKIEKARDGQYVSVVDYGNVWYQHSDQIGPASDVVGACSAWARIYDDHVLLTRLRGEAVTIDQHGVVTGSA
jgi:hypothetical protein